MSQMNELIAQFQYTLSKFEEIAARMEEREKGIDSTPDAQLMAAAPELLEALEMLLTIEPNYFSADAYERSLWQNARDTVRKTTEK